MDRANTTKIFLSQSYTYSYIDIYSMNSLSEYINILANPDTDQIRTLIKELFVILTSSLAVRALTARTRLL